MKKIIGIITLIGLGALTAGAETIFSTDFSLATQTGGVGTAISMGGYTTNGVTVSTLTSGPGVISFQYDTTSSNAPSDGNGVWRCAVEGVGTNPSSNLTEAVANNEYFQFTVSSTNKLNFDSFSFNMAKFGFALFGGVTLRSSVDNYASDLVTVTSTLGSAKYAASADLSAIAAFDNLTNVTFRFYLYDQYTGNNNRRLGVDDIVIQASSARGTLGLFIVQ
jgi:hypothetical protein